MGLETMWRRIENADRADFSALARAYEPDDEVSVRHPGRCRRSSELYSPQPCPSSSEHLYIPRRRATSGSLVMILVTARSISVLSVSFRVFSSLIQHLRSYHSRRIYWALSLREQSGSPEIYTLGTAARSRRHRYIILYVIS